MSLAVCELYDNKVQPDLPRPTIRSLRSVTAPTASTSELQPKTTSSESKQSLDAVDLVVKMRTVNTRVFTFDAGRTISRQDHTLIAEWLKQYPGTILAINFHGNCVQLALNLQQVEKSKREQFLAAVQRDFTDALLPQRLDTEAELTPKQQQDIESVLNRWHRHVIRRVSFRRGAVEYFVDLSRIGLEYHKSILMAIKGDIQMIVSTSKWA